MAITHYLRLKYYSNRRPFWLKILVAYVKPEKYHDPYFYSGILS
jgi:hypothetical protein